MFELLEDRKRHEIKWWTIPSACFIVFCGGVDAGILIGRRTTDPFEWVQVAILLSISTAILWPVGRELSRRAAEWKKSSAD